ncbi:MAG: TonB-dependent receptor [Bacteroidetes bacterium]|nr:MAG: TonB-dependent receptor [Bacteroidota bacterium]
MYKLTLTILFTVLITKGFSQNFIKGTITDKISGEPVAMASVILDDHFYTTISNEEGLFTFDKVPNGIHTITIGHLSYNKMKVTIEVRGDKELQLQMEPRAILEEGVIIRATRASGNTPVTYQNITKEEIGKRNMGKDLPILLSHTPSLVSTSNAGAGVGYTSFRIRGTDMSRINITINGIPLNDGESQNVFWVDLPDISSSVDNLQIQRGVGTSTNGAAAFGATVNVLTNKAPQEAYAKTSFSGGSFNTLRANAAVGTGLIRNHWAFDARMSRITSDGYVDRGWSSLSSYYASGAYYGKKSLIKFITFSGKESTYQAWYGVPSSFLEKGQRTYNPAGAIENSNEEIIGFYDNQTDNYKQTHYQLHFSHEFNKKVNLNAALHYTKGAGYYESYKNGQKYKKYQQEEGDIFMRDSIHKKSNLIRRKWLDNNFYGGTLSLNYTPGKWNISYGASFNIYDGDHFGKIIWAQHTPVVDQDKNWYESNGLKQDFSTFAKATYRLNNGLSFYGDIQFRSIDYSIKGLRDDLEDITQNHTYAFLNPKVGLMYRPNRHHKIYTSYAIANREPSRDNFTDADEGHIPNPEHLQNLEAGYEYQGRSVTAGINLYYMRYRDQLVLTGEINNVGDPIMVNAPNSYRTGIELMGHAILTDFLSWSANATLSRNKILDFNTYVDNWDYWNDPEHEPAQIETHHEETNISFSPSVTANNIFKFTFLEHLNVELVSQYVGKQYLDNSSNENYKLEAYFVNDIRINYTLKYKRLIKEVGFNLHINNILNEEYESDAWVYRYYSGGSEYSMDGFFPQAGTHIMGGISLSF